jgi:hypothetical protein
MAYPRSTDPLLWHVQDHLADMHATREEVRLAHRVRRPRRLRRHLGALLISAGHRLIGPSLDMPCTEASLAVARKG